MPHRELQTDLNEVFLMLAPPQDLVRAEQPQCGRGMQNV